MAENLVHHAKSQVITLAAQPEPVTIELAKTAVIVVDMQNDFGAAGGMFDRAGIDISLIQKAIGPTAKVLASARQAGIKIVYLKMAFQPDLSDLGSPDSPNRVRHLGFGVGQTVRAPNGTDSRLLIRDTWGTDIVSELAPQAGDLVIYKHRFSGFYQTDLDAILMELGVRYLIVTANLVGASPLIDTDNPLRFGPSVVRAQTKTCPDVVTAALTATDKHCVSTGRNKVCLGNASVQADPRPGAPKIKFSQPGDMTNVSSLQALRLGQYDPAASTWGIALMRLQANLPDSAPGQNLTLLLFGDVALGETPGAVAPASVGTQPAPTSAPTVKPSPTPKGAHPLQAFYFRTGIGEEGCAEAPHDGILVQSPQGLKQKVILTVNEVRLDIGSTLFLQASPSGELVVSTLDGSVTVTAVGQSQTAAAGTRVRVPLDAALKPSGPPSPPEPYDYPIMMGLPFTHLPQSLGLLPAPALPSTAVKSLWKITGGTLTANGKTTDLAKAGATNLIGTVLTIYQTDDAVWINGFGNLSGNKKGNDSLMFSKSSGGGFSLTLQGIPFQVNFTSATHAELSATIKQANCTININLQMDKIS
jgi:nicotinamidase-related amidase